MPRDNVQCCWLIADLDAWRRNQVLRVSLAVEGRALTVYEEVHGRKTAVKPKTHVQFLRGLQAVLPPGCRPILVTDAGFKTPWFQVLWLIGSIAKERGLMRHYQANTVRHREVLSVIFLGIRIIERAQDHFTAVEFCIAWQRVPLRNARVPNLES